MHLKSGLVSVTLIVSVLFLLPAPAGASDLFGTIELADQGVTWQGVTFNGINGIDLSGSSVSNAGDINGDGIDDLLIGAYLAAPNGIDDAGEVYLVYGKNGAAALNGTFDLASADVTFQGSIPNNQTGKALSNAGDINGDGIDDLLIRSTALTKTHLVYGRSGGAALSGTIDLIANADATFSGGSTSVSNAGDINGDGVDDLLIGHVSSSPNGVFWAGKTYLIYGKTGADALSGALSVADADVTFNGISMNDLSGETVSNAGDINNDGIDDLLISTRKVNGGSQPDDGVIESYLVYGQSGASELSGTVELSDLGTTLAGATFQGVTAGLGIGGHIVSNAGDVNGDGIDDLLIGSTGEQPDKRGKAYLIYGQEGVSVLTGTLDVANVGTSIAGVIFENNNPHSPSVSSAGDVNNDGVDDLLIGRGSKVPFDSSFEGQAFLVFGQTGASALSGTVSFSDIGSAVEGVAFNGIDPWDVAGGVVSNAGDINGDGIDDILVGANQADPNGISGAGETYLIYGGTLLFPPVVNFAADFTKVNPGVVVNFANQTVGTVDSRLWNFGAGEGTSALENPSNQYDASGFFDVSLGATNVDGSDLETKVGYIEVVDASLAAYTQGAPTLDLSGASVQFIDTSGGFIESRHWEVFVQGESTPFLTSSSQNPYLTIAQPGLYEVRLVVDNTLPGDGEDATVQSLDLTGFAPPVAGFSADVTKMNAGVLVNFTDLSTSLDGPLYSWDWSFGAGQGASDLQDPSHWFNQSGLFDVGLTVTNFAGSDTDTQLGLIEVISNQAGFSPDRSSVGPEGGFVQLMDTSQGFVESWEWLVFLEGPGFPLLFTSTEQNPTFRFTERGTYFVQLSVDNTLPGNGRDFFNRSAAVEVAPEPGTLVLVGLGLLGLGKKVRKRQQ